MLSAQPSILTEVHHDYLKINPRIKDFPWPGIESQSPSPRPVVIAVSYNVQSKITGVTVQALEMGHDATRPELQYIRG